MGLSAKRKLSGSWVTHALYHKIAGSWRTVGSGDFQVWRKSSGVWSPLLATVPDVLLPASTIMLNDFAISPNDAYARVSFLSDGRIERYTGTFSYQEYLDASVPITDVGEDFEIYVTENASSPDPVSSLYLNAGLGTWLPLSASRQWGLRVTGLGDLQVWLDVTIREIGNSGNTDSQLVTLNVAVEP